MANYFARFSGPAYALLRIVAGLMFAMHGAQKLFGFPSGSPVQLASLMGLAGIIELVTGVLIAVGFRTHWAAFLASGQMAVAYFTAHAPLGHYPIVNRGELAVLYCFLFLFMATYGSGAWSLDGGRRR
jgi:putative oxidoreductase